MSYSEMAQLELMNAAANVISKEDLDALKLTLSLFFAELAQRAIDKMWDEGQLDQAKLNELRGKHLRTSTCCRTWTKTTTSLWIAPLPLMPNAKLKFQRS